MEILQQKLAGLVQTIRGYGTVIVAYSGGTDSTLLLRVCADALGKERVVAVTASSETYTPAELAFAREITARLGVRHVVLATDELHDEAFASNTPDRCYHCKNHFYHDVRAFGAAEGIATIVDGSNADDLGDYRPGRRAAQENGVLSPLLDAGMTKEEVRTLSRELGLPSWDRPASPCLASRIPYGNRVTREKLEAIALAEEYLRELGFPVVRVRHHGEIARIEVAEEDLGRLCEAEMRKKVASRFREIGFTWVALDLDGYRMGSLNRVL